MHRRRSGHILETEQAPLGWARPIRPPRRPAAGTAGRSGHLQRVDEPHACDRGRITNATELAEARKWKERHTAHRLAVSMAQSARLDLERIGPIQVPRAVREEMCAKSVTSRNGRRDAISAALPGWVLLEPAGI